MAARGSEPNVFPSTVLAKELRGECYKDWFQCEDSRSVGGDVRVHKPRRKNILNTRLNGEFIIASIELSYIGPFC